MTRTGEQVVSTTPFARVLTHFMWSKTPPWSAAKTAAVLGIHRTRVANWVYRGIMPELDTMLVVMAKLGIPLRELLDAYTADGIPVPTIEPEEDAGAPTRARAASYAVPGRGRERAATAATAEPQAQQAQQEPQAQQAQQSQLAIEAQEKPQQAQEPPATRPTAQETRDAEWEKMLAHTREVMALAGMGETAIEALLSNLKDTRDGKPTEAQRRIAEEHQSSKPSKPSRPSSSRSSQSSQSSRSSQSSARAGQAGDEKPRQSPARSASPENSAYLPTKR